MYLIKAIIAHILWSQDIYISVKIVNVCYPYKLSDMIDALIRRVSVTYKCYEMYANRGEKVQLLVF